MIQMKDDWFFDIVKPYFSIPSIIIGVAGFILGVATKFADGYIKEHFDNRKRKVEHKRKIAAEVLTICNEASTNSFRTPPRDIEHIHKILTEVEFIDKHMETAMNELVSSWSSFSTRRSAGHLQPEEVKFQKEQLDRAEERRKILIRMANKMS